MSNFIIKPDGLFPSTYSQMGRVLIPSKDCNNRKIARKYTEKGATTILDTQTGMKTISTPYISTFKRFDRPSPLISLDCQNCQIVSVPSVTDKTIYPCSLNKYSVTGYTDAKNKIGVLGNSMYPRITTGDYQLYQQYKVTDKNNIITPSPPPPQPLPLIITGRFNSQGGTILPLYLKTFEFADIAGPQTSPNWLLLDESWITMTDDKGNVTVEIPPSVVQNYLFYASDNDFVDNAESEFKIISFGTATKLGQLNAGDGCQFEGLNDMTDPWPTDGTILDTSGVTSMKGMFGGCDDLTSLGPIGNWDTSGVTSMESMLESCLSLTSLGTIGNWDTSSVTNMYEMMQELSVLTSLGTIGNWDTSSVTSMENMFEACEALTSLGPIGNWDTSSVTSMEGMFASCEALIHLEDIYKWDTSSVTSMDGMFAACVDLAVPVEPGGYFNQLDSKWNTSSVPTISDFSTDANATLCDAIDASSNPLLFDPPGWTDCLP